MTTPTFLICAHEENLVTRRKIALPITVMIRVMVRFKVWLVLVLGVGLGVP